jgi:hypothetical protein
MDLEKKVMPLLRLNAGTIARVYAPCGWYWRDDLVLPSALYVNQGDLIFSACHFDIGTHSGNYYSEFDEPTIEELRLMAALLLPIGWNCGMVILSPHQASLAFDERIDFTESEAVRHIGEILRHKLTLKQSLPCSDGPPPKAFGGVPYTYRDERSPSSLQRRIYYAIDVSDHLLMRGLSALIKGPMLSRHTAFGDHALYALFIALEVSHQLIIRRLRSGGIPNPTSTDAARLIEEVFGEDPSGGRYFEEYYADRIKAFHPESRFGVYPYLPLCNSDFFSLFYDLREVFRWLILDERIILGER